MHSLFWANIEFYIVYKIFKTKINNIILFLTLSCEHISIEHYANSFKFILLKVSSMLVNFRTFNINTLNSIYIFKLAAVKAIITL